MSDRIAMAVIQRETAATFGFTRNELIAYSRKPKLVRARHTAMAIAYALTPASTTMVGRAFNRDHSSVVHALRQMREAVWDDAGQRAIMRHIVGKLYA